jgi:hypothetical protein
MTNNQNWPDRVYLVNKFDLSVFDHRINPEDAEYISAEKIREMEKEYMDTAVAVATALKADRICEIQLATIVKAFEVVLYELARSGKFGQVSTGEILDSIDPQSIIERVKI